MDNQLDTSQNLSTSNIVALSNAKEVHEETRSHWHGIVLILMVIFVFLIVGLAVFNFDGLVKVQNAQVLNYGSQVHQLTR